MYSSKNKDLPVIVKLKCKLHGPKVLGWPKTSLGFFPKMLQNELLGQPNSIEIWQEFRDLLSLTEKVSGLLCGKQQVCGEVLCMYTQLSVMSHQ